MNCMLWLLGCIIRSSSLPLEETKLIAIGNWFFHVSDFLRSFLISTKYSVILLRYSLIDCVLFPSPLLSYSI